MLASRYLDDGKPLLFLTAAQREAKRSVERKVGEGVYSFEAVPCAVCGGRRFEPIAEKDRCGLHTPVVVCGDCGLVQTNPRMTEAAYREFYDREYRILHDRESTPREAFARELRRGGRIAELLDRGGCLPAPWSRLSVLEVGCGAGGILAALRRRGCQVEGIDLAGERLLYGREHHGLELAAGTLAEVEPRRRPELVIYAHVLEHLPDPGAELARLRGLLAPGGVVYVEVPGIKRLDGVYEDDLLRYLQNAHCYHFSLTSLTNLLRRHGFERLAGDELVRSLFRVGDRRDEAWVDDRSEVLRSLAESERRRRGFHLKAALRGGIERLGLLPLARRIAGRLGR